MKRKRLHKKLRNVWMINSGKKNICIIGFIVLLAVSWFFSSGWFWNRLRLIESTEFLMNTNVTVKIYVKNRTKGKELFKRVFSEAKRIESIMESLEGEGELQKINKSPSGKWFELSPELKTVIDRSFYYYEKSGGAFDPTIASVKWLWEFDKDGRIPSEHELNEALGTVGLPKVDLKGDSLSLGNLGSKLDLGGIAKGYIVDKIIDLLMDNDVDSGLINAGGDIYTFGKKPNGDDWVIGLRHPRMNKTIVLNYIPLPAVATSGDYERYFMHEGVRYHHILDPATGKPARGCVSVTAWAESVMDADVLATTIFVLGPERGIAMAESMDNVETVVFYVEDGSLEHVVSSGIKDIIKL
ncbi:FAD:protein FMN transferase [Candidatus Latescibacterota bacterium]